MKIKCPHCNGSKQVELEGALAECLEVMRGLGPATRSEIHRATPAKPRKNGKEGNTTSATYQRVNRLEALGLVKVKDGLWRVG
jgi:hypothetical protein